MAVERVVIAGRYRLREPVGVGGMGRVWLAIDEALDREVAIKEVIPPDWLTPHDMALLRERTEREARAAARLNHPNVVKVYDVVESGEWPWIVMEYVPSRSLQQIIREDGPLPPLRTATIGIAVLDALRAAHAVGVLHRDVKPHNVLIAEDGRILLTDFGLATVDTDATITSPELILGSPQYIAPERARLGVSNELTDLWSFGATLFAAVEGRSPYARTSAAAVLTALATEPPDPPRQAGPLTPVLTAVLQREPRRRASPDEVARMLREVVAGSVPRRRRSRRVLAGAAAGLASVALLAVALLTLVRPTGSPTPPVEPGSASTAPVAAGVRTCDQSPTEAADAAPVPTGQPGPSSDGGNGLELTPMPGWSWYRDESDFYIAVPPQWSYYRVGSTVCFVDPLGFRVLGVATAAPTRDPVTLATAEATRLVSGGHLPGYQQVSLKPREFATPGAEWEFTFDAPAGRQHAITYFVTAPDRTYAVFWVTPEVEWQPSLAFPYSVISTFRPAPVEPSAK